MKIRASGFTATGAELLHSPSLEMTGKDVQGLQAATGAIAPGTRINVTFLGNEDLPMRVAASKAVRDGGFTPVSHISARRITSELELDEFLEALVREASVDHVFAVAGDPAEPMGPYADALALIESGAFQRHGVTHVSIAGYPEGHPQIADELLWSALERKSAAVEAGGFGGTILTQFGFDVDPVLAWLERVRERGITLPVRVGVPGPAGIKRLLTFAGRFGIASSAGIVQKYGFSLTNLLGTAGPDRFISDLASRLDPAKHGEVRLHFYTFGGVQATAEWIEDFTAQAEATR
jgi:methylenetetrahydrofolate reductase (NADPH)